MTSVDLPLPARALAIGAHPDDIEFQAGATLAKWAAGGCEVMFVICTDGSKGSWDPEQDTAELVSIRQQEARAAADRIAPGCSEVRFLGWPDGELASGPRQQWQVAYWIRQFRPDVVIGHDPWKRYRLHPDHRNAGFLTVDAVVAARDPHFFPEQNIPHHRPTSLLLFEADEVDHVENAEGFEEVKLAALMEHRSQLRSTMYIDDESSADQLEQFRSRVFTKFADHGALGGISHGEAFKLITRL